MRTRGPFQYKVHLFRYSDSHCKDTRISQRFKLYNGNLYSLHLDRWTCYVIRLSYLYNENAFLEKRHLYIETTWIW